jgi:hypothetical protein
MTGQGSKTRRVISWFVSDDHVAKLPGINLISTLLEWRDKLAG